jgi:hypothetical protein
MKTIKSILAITFVLFTLTAAKIESKPTAKEGACELTIKYSVSKINVNGNEMDMKLLVTINPTAKTVLAVMEGRGEKTTKIEIKECTLSADLTSGYALYQTMDEKSELMKIEIKDKKIIIFNPKPETEDDNVKMTVEKWEIVK